MTSLTWEEIYAGWSSDRLKYYWNTPTTRHVDYDMVYFEQRDARSPAVPTPREAWLAATSLRAPGAVRITDMAVHDRGELAIVSFSLQLEGQGPSTFVVDVWRQRAPNAYELVTRYASAVAPPPAAAPATTPATGKPPDGKG